MSSAAARGLQPCFHKIPPSPPKVFVKCCPLSVGVDYNGCPCDFPEFVNMGFHGEEFNTHVKTGGHVVGSRQRSLALCGGARALTTVETVSESCTFVSAMV